jgi:hypothetical protein
MGSFEFVPIAEFLIQLPEPLYPYRRKESIKTCLANQLHPVSDEWIGIQNLGEYFPSSFAQRNHLNLPGPIFGAETDTCAAGPHEAPLIILLDRNGQEFLFRQPSDPGQFRDVISAAICECFHGYGAAGDNHWRLESIREWWRSRTSMLSSGIDEDFGDRLSFAESRQGLEGAYLPYLRVYALFVENGRKPGRWDSLPDL